MPKGFAFLILAQFLSGLADNAFLLLGIYFLQEQGHPGWWAPLLKMAFTLSYVVLASVVGPVADAFQKRHAMMAMNGLKLVSVVLLWTGFSPLVAFALTGFAASVYAPAKYGLPANDRRLISGVVRIRFPPRYRDGMQRVVRDLLNPTDSTITAKNTITFENDNVLALAA